MKKLIASTVMLAIALSAAAIGAASAFRAIVTDPAAAATTAGTVQLVDGKDVAWWARRSRRNGRTARAEARTIRALRPRLHEKVGPVENLYEDAARAAAATYGVDAATLIRKGRCESADWTRFWNPSSGAEGPWQFLPTTWRSTPYATFSPYDPVAAALAAAWMHAHGRGGEWECR